MDNQTFSGVDERETASFRKTAGDWWNPAGPYKPLHAIGPVRIAYIREQLVRHYGRDARSLKPLDGLAIADIGCGGGLLCEPLARMGANVVGIDPVAEAVAAARTHAAPQNLTIEYLVGGADDLAARTGSSGAAAHQPDAQPVPGYSGGFDAVISMEVIEHVPGPEAFVRACAACVKPGGLLILSTINRTMRSYALAIIGAEYILRWLPRGTHQWDRFITPAELSAHIAQAGLSHTDTRGCIFDPLAGEWRLSTDTAVNYFMTAAKSA